MLLVAGGGLPVAAGQGGGDDVGLLLVGIQCGLVEKGAQQGYVFARIDSFMPLSIGLDSISTTPSSTSNFQPR